MYKITKNININKKTNVQNCKKIELKKFKGPPPPHTIKRLRHCSYCYKNLFNQFISKKRNLSVLNKTYQIKF